MPYFSDDDVREMQRREREDDERAYASKARAEARLNRSKPCPLCYRTTVHIHPEVKG